jgi:peptide/nickel transport system permease protein
VSLLLAPIAAALSVMLAASVGTIAGYLGGIWERTILGIIDLFLSLPWLFLLITVRAALPLNVSPIFSVIVTFLLLGLLGWATSARVVCAGVSAIKRSDFMIGARATGCSSGRSIFVHLIPNLKRTLWAQFLVSIPLFILTEANLTILGLGVAEPLPSWGSLLREINVYSDNLSHVWRLAPLFLLMIVVWAFQIACTTDEVFT